MDAKQTLLIASSLAAASGYSEIPYKRWGKIRIKGNKGQKEATKARNRAKNRVARKSRRLNLRRGKFGRYSS